MAELLLANFAWLWGQALLPPEALRLAQTCRAARALRRILLLSVSPAWRARQEVVLAQRGPVPPGRSARPAPEGAEGCNPVPVVKGLQLCALVAYYRRATPEPDALLLLNRDRAPPLPNSWARWVLGNEALHLAVRYGHSRVLRWLRGAYGLGATDARFRVCVDLRRAGVLTHFYTLRALELAPAIRSNQYNVLAALLLEAYGAANAIKFWCAARCLAFGDGCALRAAATSGHAGCVRALFETYGLSAADALRPAGAYRPPEAEPGTPLDYAVYAAIQEEGGLSVLLAFWEGAGLTPRDVVNIDWEDHLFGGALAGRLSLLKWVETSCLTPDRVCDCTEHIAVGAAQGGHLAVLQWLHAYLRAQRRSRRFPWKTARRQSSGHPLVQAWISETARPADNSSSEDDYTSEGNTSDEDGGSAS